MTGSETEAQRVKALVLAGAANDGPLKDVSDVPNEALIDIGGKPMITYVLDALHGVADIETIGIVGPVDTLRAGLSLRDEVLIEAGGDMLDNLERGARALDPAGTAPLLVVTADIPLLTAESVAQFLVRCRQEAAAASRPLDAFYPMVGRAASEAAFPGVERTYVNLRDGRFTGGNFALLDPKAVLSRRHVFDEVVALRKKPLQMARLLGFGFIVKFLFRRLTTKDIAAFVDEKIGIHGVVIDMPYAEIGFDVDKPADLALARARLGGG